MTKIDTSIAPYFDDANEKKKFYRILFRKGRAVQARELTQLQTLLQKQIERMGSHIFDQGAQVLPGSKEGVKYINNNHWIKIPRSANADNKSQLETYWLGKTIVSTSGAVGIKAEVIGVREPDSLNEARLFLKYLNADTASGTYTEFSAGQNIQTDENPPITATIVPSGATGTVSSVAVEEGVYFYGGNFIYVEAQTLFLAPSDPEIQADWTNRPTTLAGLEIIESIVTSEDDESLLDNSIGSPNYSAPGADRLKIDANLIQVGINSDKEDFIPLLKVIDGTVQYRVVKTEYSVLEDTLARRTSDESGDYTVQPFSTSVREFLRDDLNDGAHLEAEFFYETQAAAQVKSLEIFKESQLMKDAIKAYVEANPGQAYPGEASQSHPVFTSAWLPASNYQRFLDLCDSMLSLKVDPGKAYVKGYEIEKTAVTVVDVPKARSLKFRNNKVVYAPLGTFLYVTNMYGNPTFQNYDQIELHGDPIAVTGTSPGNKIGTARALSIEFFSGVNGPTGTYRLFIFDVKVDPGKDLGQIKSLYSSSPTFTADCVTNSFRLTGSVYTRGSAVQASGILTSNGTNVSNGDTVTLGSKVYTFQTALTNVDGNVLIGANATASLNNLAAAINLGSGAGTLYATLTTLHPTIKVSHSGLVITATAKNVGVSGNLAISKSAATLTWSPSTTTLVGGADVSTIAPANTILGSGTSWKNDSLQRLKAGDYIRVGQDVGSKLYKVTNNPSNDNTLLVTPDPTTDSHTWTDPGATIDYVFSSVQGTEESNALIYKLPDEIVYTIRGGEQGEINDAIIDTTYSSKRVSCDGVSNSQANGSSKLILPTLSGTESYASFSPLDYVVIRQDTGQWLQLLPYVAGSPVNGTAEVQVSGANVTIHFPPGIGYQNQYYYVISTIIRTGGSAGSENSKTLQKGVFTLGTYSGPSVATADSNVSEISLGVADVLRVTRIVQSPDFSTIPQDTEVLTGGHKDITALYELDNGQRDYYYDIGRVLLRPGVERPTGRVRVEFDYFTHNGTGNYFSVDSYPFRGIGANMEYGDIPLYNSPKGGQYDLVSCLDFRPRAVEPGGANSLPGFSTYIEPPRDYIRCDYHFYESRIDKLYLDRTGKFLVKYGVPEPYPTPPAEPDAGMSIYELYMRAFTATPQDCVLRMIDNRRFTMRDIGKLQKRIQNLEYYTSLSLLEKDATELVIKDAQGNDKFKNGILADNFNSFRVSDLGSLDFRCSLDLNNGEARPLIYESNVSLFERNTLEENEVTLESLREDNHYQRTGEVFTLPYTPVSMVEQRKASKVSNVNPYAVFTYVGAVEINPWSDEWRDTNRLEPNEIKDSSAFEAVQKTFGPEGTNVSYGATVNNWTGLDTTSESTGVQRLLIAGHADVKTARQSSQQIVPNTEQVTVAGSRGSTGKSTQKGPGKKSQDATRRSGRSIVGGHRGGKKK